MGTGLEEVQFVARQRNSSGGLTDVEVRITLDPGNGPQLHIGEPSTEPLQPLDDYRQKVLRAARRGKFLVLNLDAGAALTIALPTVRTHIGNLMNKLGVHSRLEAVAGARRRGLVD